LIHSSFIALIDSTFKFDESIDDAWKYLLTKTLKPSSIEEVSFPTESAKIANSGLTLQVSSGNTDKTIILSGKQLNRSLFNSEDIKLVNSLKDAFDKIIALKNEKEKIREIERSRIMQDLHDDVCPNLLDLSRKVSDPILKNSALNSYDLLRDTIYLLSDDMTWDLEDLALSWRGQIHDRLTGNSITLDWSEKIQSKPKQIQARYKVNIERILRETITNILKHSHATHVFIQVIYLDETLTFIVRDNGICDSLSNFNVGSGVNNMKRRLNDMGSQLKIKINNLQEQAFSSGVEIYFSVDLSKREKYE
jgi:signal transduction histidine kinase